MPGQIAQNLFSFLAKLRSHGPPFSPSLITIIESMIVTQPILFLSPEFSKVSPTDCSFLHRPKVISHVLHTIRLAIRWLSLDTRTPPCCGVSGGHPHSPPTTTIYPPASPAARRLQATHLHVCMHNPTGRCVTITIK